MKSPILAISAIALMWLAFPNPIASQVEAADSLSTGSTVERVPADTVQRDVIFKDRFGNDSIVPNEYHGDTARHQEFNFRIIARPTGDKIILRWATDQYAAWRMACRYGYDILRYRYTADGFVVDTLSHALKPQTLDELMQHFPASDSIAGAAAMMLYEKGTALSGAHGMQGIADIYDEQQTRLAYALLIAEFRPDLADAMALRYVDTAVKEGEEYEYIVHPLVPDSILTVSSASLSVKNIPYQHPPFNPQITDSLQGGKGFILYWPIDPQYTAYDIERRVGNQWKRLNEHPFFTYLGEDRTDGDNMFIDAPLEIGSYDYRIRPYDSFGETGPWSPLHTAVLPDVIAPVAPQIKYFKIDRTNNNDSIFANIIWEKDTIESDFTGYDIYYFHESVGKEWIKLNDKMLAPSDTLYRAEVSNLPSGYITVVALDSCGNKGGSMPRELHIADLVPPIPPTGLHHIISPRGVVMLLWSRNPERDIKGYEVMVANDTAHIFVPLPGSLTNDTIAYDTLQVIGINQRYIYYRVKAYDFAGNWSQSEIYRVQRLNYDKPIPCRLDSVWQTDSTLCMRWQTMAEHTTDHYNLYRRIEGDAQWQLVKVITVEDQEVPDNMLVTQDNPPYNRSSRYFYAIEAVGISGFSSGLSSQTSFSHTGPDIVEVTPQLQAVYNEKEKSVDLSWTLGSIPIGECYVSVEWDKGNGYFSSLETLPITQDRLRTQRLEKGESAIFRIRLHWDDGRVSLPSNQVTITRSEP